ncbi:hypothetical protein H4R19_002848 [Coemansia spiralis]|nr:hypothetical protein H4R19_002848 [Coemansia spiralis]
MEAKEARRQTFLGDGAWRCAVVANDGSMARDQFAAERNFLSWIKLALAVVSSAAIVVGEAGWRTPRAQVAASVVYLLVLAFLVVAATVIYLWRTQWQLACRRQPLRMFPMVFAQTAGCIAAASLVFVLALDTHQTH